MIITLETILGFTCGLFLGTTISLGIVYIIIKCKNNVYEEVEQEKVENYQTYV